MLRRYFAGDPLGNEERDAAVQMIKRFKNAASRLAVLDVLTDRKPGAGFISALNEVLRSEGAPCNPREGLGGGHRETSGVHRPRPGPKGS